MSAFEDRLLREVLAEVDRAIATEAGHLARGLAADHADYRHRCGTIKGLERAKDIAEEAHSALFGPKGDK